MARQDVNESMAGAQARDRPVHIIALYYLRTINKGSRPICSRLQFDFDAVVGPRKLVPRKPTPPRKRATAIIQVGVDNPEGTITLVDVLHIVYCVVDANCSLAITASQLVGLNTAPRWIASPTERGRYVSKMAARERRTGAIPMKPPLNVIW